MNPQLAADLLLADPAPLVGHSAAARQQATSLAGDVEDYAAAVDGLMQELVEDSVILDQSS